MDLDRMERDAAAVTAYAEGGCYDSPGGESAYACAAHVRALVAEVRKLRGLLGEWLEVRPCVCHNLNGGHCLGCRTVEALEDSQ